MLELNRGQRLLLSSKLAEVGNIAVGTALFGQLLGASFSWRTAILGLGVWALLIAVATGLEAGDE